MQSFLISQLNTKKDDSDKKIAVPKADKITVSATEKLVREDIEKLAKNTEDIRKLKEQIEKKRGGSE